MKIKTTLTLSFLAFNHIAMTQPNRLAQKSILPVTAISRFAEPTGITQINYYDGLGRICQKVDESFSTSNKDLIQSFSYDQFGRLYKEFLPYSIDKSGNFHSSYENECLQFYQNQTGDLKTQVPFSNFEYENAPISFQKRSAAAGENFKMGSGHEQVFVERPSLANDKILQFDFNYSNMKPIVKTYPGQLAQQLNFDGINTLPFNFPTGALINCTTVSNTGLSPNSSANEPKAFVFNSGYGNTISFNLPQGTYLLSCMLKKFNGASTVVYFKNNTTSQIYNGQFPLENEWTEVKINFTISSNNNQLLISCSGPTGKVLLDDIRIYKNLSSTIQAQYYPDGACWVKNSINSNRQKMMQVYDAFNNLILQRNYDDTVIARETYYVYNKHGLMASVIQPEGVKTLQNNAFDFQYKINNGSGSTASLFDLYVQQNIYDERNRLISYKLPGVGPTCYVYDLMDRMTMSQDPQQSLAAMWTFQKFDQQERPIIKGVFQTERNMSRAEIQDKYNKTTTYYELPDRTPLFYTNQVFPTTNIIDTLVLNYYDTYDPNFDSNKEWDFELMPYNLIASKKHCLKGLAVSKAKLLGKSGSAWITKINGFDELNRNNLQVEMLPTGGINTTEYQFNFMGKVTHEVKRQQLSPKQNIYKWSFENEFDERGRLKRTWLTNPDGNQVIMREINYNELGHTIQKQIHSLGIGQPFLQTIDYSFDIYGQMNKMNDIKKMGSSDLFAMDFYYDKSFSLTNGGGIFRNTPNYLSDISACSWLSKRDNVTRGFIYDYDSLNQLKSASYFGNSISGITTENGRYDVKNINYDLNGNLLTMKQSGLINSKFPLLASSYDWMDELSYSYTGNQLVSVSDGSIYNSPGYNHFIDRNSKGVDYVYDANQRLISDKNKLIQLISYNQIGLVSSIKWNNGDELEMVYDALGNKHQSYFSSQGKRIQSFQYEAGTFYVNNQLKFITHDEGRMVQNKASSLKANAGNFLFHYDYTDHQGNTRMTYTPMMDSTGNWLCTYEFEEEQTQEFDTTYFAPNDFPEQFLNKSTPIQTMEMAYQGKYAGKVNTVMGTNITLHANKGDTIFASVFGKLKDDGEEPKPLHPNWIYQLLSLQQIQSDQQVEYNAPSNTGIYLNFIALLQGLKYMLNPIFDKPSYKGFLVLRALDSNNQVLKAIAVPVTNDQNWDSLSAQLVIDSTTIQKVQVYVSASNENTVYYDNFTVVRKRMLAQIVQENHYYPFGLNIQGLEFELPGIDTNTIHLYNGKELILKNFLEYYDHGARFLDPQIGRWISMDIMAGKFISQSPFVVMQNNPVNKIDYNGMEAWEPPGKFGFVLGIRVGIGTSGLNINGTSSIGYQIGAPSTNLQLLGSLSMYGGNQLGTNTTHSFQFDLSGGFLLQAGMGTANAHRIYTMNYNTPSPFQNTNEYSAQWGQMFTYNSAINQMKDGPGVQTQGLFGMRMGSNFSFSYNNDATSFPTFAGLFRNAFHIKETDAAWTGTLTMNIAGVEMGYQNFSGYRLMNYPGFGVGHRYPQTSYHQSFNRASNFIQYNGLRLDVFGSAWLQNFIHKHISKESTYEYPYKNHLNLSGSIR
jgi:RHS repeat-associated protein